MVFIIFQRALQRPRGCERRKTFHLLLPIYLLPLFTGRFSLCLDRATLVAVFPWWSRAGLLAAAKEWFSTPSGRLPPPDRPTAGTSLGQEPAYSFQKLTSDLRGQLFNQFHPLSGRYRHHIDHSRYGTADDDSGGRRQLKSLLPPPPPPPPRRLVLLETTIRFQSAGHTAMVCPLYSQWDDFGAIAKTSRFRCREKVAASAVTPGGRIPSPGLTSSYDARHDNLTFFQTNRTREKSEGVFLNFTDQHDENIV